MSHTPATSRLQGLAYPLIFATGLAAVAWVGWGFIGASPLALVMTALIAAVYLLGVWELNGFRAATHQLERALAQVPQPLSTLSSWTAALHPSLRSPVHLRIEGERVALPGPALTPYLVGLLVMLGMMGTFLGMVVTFKGAVFALEGSADLVAIRSALAEPIKGLGLSFGTSVAGVAASAMLGLLSTLSRRERMAAARQLDAAIATVFQPFTASRQREDTVRALQAQAQALPQIVDGLRALMESMDRRTEHLHQHLLTQQTQFHQDVANRYGELARSVGQSLQDSLTQGARQSGEAIQPVVTAAMADIVRHSARVHEQLIETTRDQVAGLSVQLSQADQERLAAWHDALARQSAALVSQWQHVGADAQAQQQSVCESLERAAAQIAERASRHVGDTLEGASRLVEQSEALVQSRLDAESRWQQLQGERMDQMATLWRTELQALRDDEARRARAAVDQLEQLQAAAGRHLADLGAALEAPLHRLLHTASEVPQAASDVIAQLRREMVVLAERDTAALAEKQHLMEQLAAVLDRVHEATDQHRSAIDSLVSSASGVLAQTAEHVTQALGAQAERIDTVQTQVAHQLTASAVELASLGESFQAGVSAFAAGSARLIDQLQRIESALSQAQARSDEQLAYYVAQAREVIDLSISSQQGIVEDLRRLQGRAVAAGG